MDFVFNICSSMNFTMSTDTVAADRQPSAVKSAELFADGISAKAVDAEYIPLNRWNYWQETNDDVKIKATVTATPTAACILVAACMHRDTVSIEGDGWTKLIESEIKDGVQQRMTVWYKAIEAVQTNITVNQASNARMSLKCFALYNTAGVSVVDNALSVDGYFTPTHTTGKRRLYLIDSVYATGSNNAISASYQNIDLRSAEETRFSAWYDYQPEKQVTPTFSTTVTDYTANTAGILTIDIEEE